MRRINFQPFRKPKLTRAEFRLLLRSRFEEPKLSDSLQRALEELMALPDYLELSAFRAQGKALVWLAKRHPEVFTKNVADRLMFKLMPATRDWDGRPIQKPLTDLVELPNTLVTVCDIRWSDILEVFG